MNKKSGYREVISMLLFSMVLILAGAICSEVFAATNPLQRLQKLASASDGRVGICAWEVNAKSPVCVNGDEKFSLQSVMKLVVAAVVMDAVDNKKLQLNDEVVLRPEHASPGPQDFADKIKGKGSLTVTIEELIHRAVVDSDSTSVDFLIDRIDGIAVVQEFLKRKQIEGIRIDRDERHLQAESMGLGWKAEYADSVRFKAAVDALSDEKRAAAWDTYLKDPRDTATPAGMVNFLRMLASGNLLSPLSTQSLLGVIAKTRTGKDRLMAGTPRDWAIGHKTGTSPTWKGMCAATNDVGLLTSPDGSKIAIAVFVAESKRSGADRAAIIAGAARIVTTEYQKF